MALQLIAELELQIAEQALQLERARMAAEDVQPRVMGAESGLEAIRDRVADRPLVVQGAIDAARDIAQSAVTGIEEYQANPEPRFARLRLGTARLQLLSIQTLLDSVIVETSDEEMPEV